MTDRKLEEEGAFQAVLNLIDFSLKEDIRTGDITSEACLTAEDRVSGRLMLKQGGRVAGLAFLEPLFHKLDKKVDVRLMVEEGSEHQAGTVLAKISGPARAIFGGERVALNLLQHASGIATFTGEYVERVEGLPCQIFDSRRTHPGLRCLERYAVRIGGGVNHRQGLDDRFIIKHNHLALIGKESKHPIREAVRRVQAYKEDITIEVEVDSLEALEEALEASADIVLLDHMPLPMIRRAVDLVKGRAFIEAVGIDLETVRAYAEAGVDGISIPVITFNAKPLEIRLRFA